MMTGKQSERARRRRKKAARLKWRDDSNKRLERVVERNARNDRRHAAKLMTDEFGGNARDRRRKTRNAERATERMKETVHNVR